MGNFFAIRIAAGGEIRRYALPCMPALAAGCHLADTPQNLLLFSEQLDNAQWTKVNTVINADVTLGPEAVVTADRIRENVINSTFDVAQSITMYAGSAQLCFSMYVKANGRTAVRLRAQGNAGDSAECNFDLTTLVASIASFTSGASIFGFGMEDVGNGWRRCWFSFRFTSTWTSMRIRLVNAGATTYLGDGVSGVYAWGSQLERGGAPTAYLPTSASPAHPSYVPHNWIPIGSNFENANWNPTRVTPTANAVIGPHGATTADTLLETVNNGQHFVSYGSAGAFGPYVGSIYVKNAGRNDVVLSLAYSSDIGEARFDLTTGAVVSTAVSGAGVVVFARAQACGEGWWRLIVGFNSSGGIGGMTLTLHNGTTTTYAGNTSLGVHVYGAELVNARVLRTAIAPLAPPATLFRDSGIRVLNERNAGRTIIADRPFESGKSYYFEATVVSGGVATIGIALLNVDTNTVLGTDVNGWGYRQDGVKITNNTTGAYGAAFTNGDTVGVLLMWQTGSSNWSLYFVKNPSGAITLPTAAYTGLSNTFFAAIGLGTAASTVAVDWNFGQKVFKGVPPMNTQLGVFESAIDRERRFGSLGRVLTEAGTGERYHYAPLIMNNPLLQDRVSCWVWGRDREQAAIGEIEINIAGGALRDFIAMANRGRRAEIYAGADTNTTLAGMTRIATVVLQAVNQTGAEKAALVLTDRKQDLKVALQPNTYPTTTVNTAIRGKPRPITMGDCRWIPPVATDPPNLDFDVHQNASFIGITEVRQNGALLATPADYGAAGAGTFGFRRATAVNGKQCVRVNGASKAGPLIINRLPDWITWLCVTQTARLVAGDIDTAGTITALDTAAPYTLALHVPPDAPIMVDEALDMTMDSFCGDYYFDRNGVLKVWRLEPPMGVPDFTFDENDLVSEVTRVPDEAKALTNQLGFARNYAVHSTGEIAGALATTAIATELASDYQVRRSTVVLSGDYSFAAQAEKAPTLLSDGTQAQTEVDRVNGQFPIGRGFYEARVALGDGLTGWQMNFGALIKITSKASDVEAGKLFRFVGRGQQPLGNELTMLLWG